MAGAGLVLLPLLLLIIGAPMIAVRPSGAGATDAIMGAMIALSTSMPRPTINMPRLVLPVRIDLLAPKITFPSERVRSPELVWSKPLPIAR
ncbi:hypothetical protein [Bradyrhizobium niftali]|uniref:Uncharacterized protein n=1 Tax=Bradyrhizobium niftali TaxID=2560055 RepID=A0A4Y9LZC9_9BRAD|nr:hypothetical protein [Bradyrhizobium niftali]TFV48279.1 hypothetical protein E4K65_12750 [Bradyrhizobium niftali]